MRFQKWQALGNDYIILEARELPWELSAERIERLCDPHFGVGADGVLLLSDPDQPGFVARLRIFNPDGSEAELSGNGAREAILYLRRAGWTDQESFSIQTMAGAIHPTITGTDTCRVAMGRASLSSHDYPDGGPDGRGSLEAGGRTWAFQHVSIGNPQCAIAVSDPDELEQIDLESVGPGIERHPHFPRRTNVSWFTPLGSGRIRARIFERGVGETLSSGTGASGAAVAHLQAGGRSPVTVLLDGGELVGEVSDDLDVTLTGWALPIYSGNLSKELIEELHATQ